VNVPPLLESRRRYERATHGWSDCAVTGDAFLHTVRIADPDCEVELRAEALPSPSYALRSITARAPTGAVDPRALHGLATLAGTAMVTGLGRRVREATGGGVGADVLLDAVIEVARLARQVACLPRERVERAVAGGAAGLWALDHEGWIDLRDSCFTYSDAGGGRLSVGDVAAGATPDLYSPRPGQTRVFERRRVSRLERDAERLRLTGSMHDNVHGFEIFYEVDLATGRIVRADSTISRLPYAGICSEPQGKIHSMLGETVDAGLSKRVQSLLGGATGCAQLFDLTTDLLKLVAAPRVY
jgi:Protein of unknown function (DUF2889)